MLSKFKIGTRLGVAFAIVSLLLLGTLAAGVIGLNAIQHTAHVALEEDVALGFNAAAVQRQGLELRRYEKDTFINIGDREAVASYRDRWQNAYESLTETLAAGEVISRTDAIDALYEEAGKALEGYEAGYAAVYQRIANGQLTATATANEAFGEYKPAIYRLENAAQRIDEAVSARVSESILTVDREYQSSLVALLVSAAAALALAVVLAVLITRSIARPLEEAVRVAQRVAEGDLTSRIEPKGRDEVAKLLTTLKTMQDKLSELVSSLRASSASVYAGANEIAEGSQDLSSRTEEQAAALQETAASMEEITSTVRQNADSSDEARRLSTEAAQKATNGNQDVERTIELMRTISESSKEINELVGVIDSIAFQTNILALNASVEAARAGESGRGFAVVATEVRSLASRSAEAAKRVRETVSRTAEHITSGATQAERNGHTMKEIVESVGTVATLMSEIAAATREQHSAIGQVNTAVTEMDSVTQQNASLVQQTSSASASLESQAKHLSELVSTFQVASEYDARAQAPRTAAKPAVRELAPTRQPVVASEEEWTTF
ncbi:methyl-accepting chemotaxis protein [Salinicola halophilus]|uniref:methyl-accepting chemotaxis protein n=1 Tax=Salinicola halophilus TaxID=184065 RepID=UPI000DA1F6A7|nr:methyl-accepting chemotaxis protein [Salinicola halophilus]